MNRSSPGLPVHHQLLFKGSQRVGHLKGVKPPVEFGKRIRDSSPGHAGKEGPQLARTGGARRSGERHRPQWLQEEHAPCRGVGRGD